MDLRERLLYHQIHPFKLFTDFSTAFGAAGLFWHHRFWWALALGFVPSIVVTMIMVRWVDLEPYRDSAFGRYVARFMTRRVELARFAGLIPLWLGAWRQSIVAIVAGVAWIVLCWLSGLRSARASTPTN